MAGHHCLVSSDWLAMHRCDPRLRIVDVRFSLADAGAGRRAYAAGHVPGAVYLHLDEDLSGPVSDVTGRHPLPEPRVFAATLARAGIGGGHRVVAYDDAGGAIASRLWWMLRWLGHGDVAVLDGGLAAWTAGGHPLTGDAPTPVAAAFDPRPRGDMLVTAGQVESGLSRADMLLVDAREEERFRGESEPIDTVAGRVPGSVNFPFRRNLDADGCMLPADELRTRWSALLAGRPPAAVACMCGSGVTACLDLLAMELAGLTGARLYAGSWSEWIRDPDRPVARGPGPGP